MQSRVTAFPLVQPIMSNDFTHRINRNAVAASTVSSSNAEVVLYQLCC